MANTRWLSKFLKWVFGGFVILLTIAAVAIVAVMVIDPKLPPDATVGRVDVQVLGQPGSFVVQNSQFAAALIKGGVQMRVNDAPGLVEVAKHTGLPMALLAVLYYAMLFGLMHRLFRNVGGGESFTRQNVRLVQIIGFSLLIYSVISAFAEGWFEYAIFDYLSQHAVFQVSGTAFHLPPPANFTIGSAGNSPFGSPVFFTGLLVLALSEVFRQGLALKIDHDLTI
jgi:hypothetical protein